MAWPVKFIQQRRWVGSLAIGVALSVVGSGCSKVNEGGRESVVMDVGRARGKVKEASSQLFDVIGIRAGKVTPGGPGVSTCKEDPKHIYQVYHTWSVYGVPMDELSRGFDGLKQRLPADGWKIIKSGPNDSPAKTPEILADSSKEQFTANIAFVGSGSGEPGIMVSLVSACFRVPEGADLSGEY
ncbi:hypothetical protein [Streptomyces sp. NPDC021096]|uniref:hypothetical protein n=1 Tax=Streptomyces sp. NPDC021096 TaxID=3154792 RepID=UPI0033F12524